MSREENRLFAGAAAAHVLAGLAHVHPEFSYGEKRSGTITYGELAKLIGWTNHIHDRGFGEVLDYAAAQSKESYGVDHTKRVVRKSDGYPSKLDGKWVA